MMKERQSIEGREDGTRSSQNKQWGFSWRPEAESVARKDAARSNGQTGRMVGLGVLVVDGGEEEQERWWISSGGGNGDSRG